MARFVDAIDLPIPPEEAFDYLADFSHAESWDPGVVEAKALTRWAPRLGSRFRVVAGFLGRRIPLEYRISAFERPRRLVFAGGDDTLRSVDELTFSPRGQGTRVTYEATLELRGLRACFDPALDVAFQLIGRVAAAGLRKHFRDAARARDGEAAEPDAAPKGKPSPSTRGKRAKPTSTRRSRSNDKGAK